MARPSKKQLADRKAAKDLEKRNARLSHLERAYLIRPFAQLADFVYLECEACGQEQLGTEYNDSVCIICGHDIARTHTLHGELKREAEAILRGFAA